MEGHVSNWASGTHQCTNGEDLARGNIGARFQKMATLFVRRGERGVIEQMNAAEGRLTHREQQWQSGGHVRTNVPLARLK